MSTPTGHGAFERETTLLRVNEFTSLRRKVHPTCGVVAHYASRSLMRTNFDRALQQTKSRAPGTFDAWFSQIQLEDFTDGILTLRAHNTFARDWVANNYLPHLVNLLREDTGRSIQINWVIGQIEKPLAPPPFGDEPAPSSRITYASRPAPGSTPGANIAQAALSLPAAVVAAASSTVVSPIATSPNQPATTLVSVIVPEIQQRQPTAAPEGLNPKFTFENFVVGPSNQLAHAAALAITGDGGKRYNPLFLCGTTGLGKTHLVHAVAHRIHKERPDKRILYVSAEKFTNDYIEALQGRKMEDFRRLYRNGCDVLLVDDVHSLVGRKQTQEEFFHTFNALYTMDRAIILTSDSYPQKLQGFEERLMSRFQWGLVADIQTPDLETRVAIARKKAASEGVLIDDDVTLMLATTLRSSVRELEGMIIRLAAKSSLTGAPITADFLKSELQQVQAARPKITSIDEVQRLVCHHFQIRSTDLLSKDRSKTVAMARHVAMYLCKSSLQASYPEVGRAFGKDHTTVMSAVKKMKEMRERDAQLRSHLEELERQMSLT